MHPAIRTVTDHQRGCGWRKPGGLYLVADGPAIACGRLPIPAVTCPCCGHGIRPARGWTWVDADKFIEAAPPCELDYCGNCPLNLILESGFGMAGLIWIGEKFYPTPESFLHEAAELGISRRITQVPNDFMVGETWVLLGHRKAIIADGYEIGKKPEYIPGIFRIFKPDRIEVIVTGEESDDEIERYLERGLTPVLVERAGEAVQPELEMEGVNHA